MLHNSNVKRPDAPTGGFNWENGLRDETIQSRALEISYQGKKWNEITDLGALSNTSYSGYNWRSSEGKLPSGEDNMSVQLKVTAKGGREVLSNVDQISVKQFSISNVVAEHLADKTRETYNLILFTYNKSDMGKWNHKILDEYVYNRIEPNSDVSVNGYTDILGTEDYNTQTFDEPRECRQGGYCRPHQRPCKIAHGTWLWENPTALSERSPGG